MHIMNLQNKTKPLFAVVIVITVFTLGFYFYIYQGHASVLNQDADFTGQAFQYWQSHNNDEKFKPQSIVQLSGVVTSVTDDGFTIDKHIFCQLHDSSSHSEIKLKQPIEIKGRVTGYDDLFDQFKVDQAHVITRVK